MPFERVVFHVKKRERRRPRAWGGLGPEQRPMGGYLSLPVSLTDEEKTAWMVRALDHVSTLPPKVKNAR